jgi:hypothetical protein
MTVATILIPTFNHGRLIRHSVTSALAQTEADIEVFVVGDGAPPITGEIVTDIARRDPRVRWFGNSKGPRHGEVHRARALRHARGEIVSYLSDDELYFPDHIETMRRALRSADVVSAAIAKPTKHGPTVRTVDLSIPYFARRLREGVAGSPLSGIAHTAAAYRALPHGWRTTPPDVATDRYMLQQFLENGATFTCADRVTVLGLPSPEHEGISLEEAAERMSRAAAGLADPRRRQALRDELAATLLAERPLMTARFARLAEKLERAQRRARRYRQLAGAALDEDDDAAGQQGDEDIWEDDSEPGIIGSRAEG